MSTGEADHRPASRDPPPRSQRTSGLEDGVPTTPHLPCSHPARKIVRKENHFPITRQLEEICPAPFLKLFVLFCLHLIVLIDGEKNKNPENLLSWRSWQLLVGCNTVGTKKCLLFPPTLTELQVAYSSRLCMYIFSY